ncbi:MAG: hypothetical protein HQK53_02680 [Oligoflexia bacterium]|nr:hypothetical protein [Oligoflexia bacterium]
MRKVIIWVTNVALSLLVLLFSAPAIAAANAAGGITPEGTSFTSFNGFNSFYKSIEKIGYIPYFKESSPDFAGAGVGAMVGGPPGKMGTIAAPEVCFYAMFSAFPPNINIRGKGEDKVSVKVRVESVWGDLLNFFRLHKLGKNANKNILKTSPTFYNLDSGSGNRVHSVVIDFLGLREKRIDVSQFGEFYKRMPEGCKQYFNLVPFILDELLADELIISFYDKDGKKILLDSNNHQAFVDIVDGAEINTNSEGAISLRDNHGNGGWHLGYRLGRLRSNNESNGLLLYALSDVKSTKLYFKKISAFEDGIDVDNEVNNDVRNEVGVAGLGELGELDESGERNLGIDRQGSNGNIEIRDLSPTDLIDMFSVFD